MPLYLQISRGSVDPKKQGTSSLIDHFKKIHSEAFRDSSNASGDRTRDDPVHASSSSHSEGQKRSGTMAKLYELCPKKNRTELFQQTIEGLHH